uniref:Uncharacterized protein n=1 Tax=Avena sativa TaxID=4498 RepID=A0ACD6AF98_AVESA
MALAPHLVFVPSAGMGHLLPFSRFITALANTGAVDISVVTALPTVSAAEAEHFDGLFAAFPAIRRIDFNLLPFDESVFAGADPFHLQWESLRRSAHLLGPMIASATPRASAVITDVTLASQVIPIAKDELHLPCHVLFVSCATMLSFLAYFPTYLDGAEADHLAGDVDVPGIGLIPVDYPPAVLRNSESLFTKHFIANGRLIAEADGILVNTFDALEPDALAALRSGKVVPGFPQVFAVGPLMSSTTTGSDKAVLGTSSSPIAWLDAQPARSVVYVAFGNRNAVVPDQIREIGAGLEASGCPFLWVVKTTVVDREDNAELKDVLGDGFLVRVQGRGLVTKEWVDQEAVLKHPAIGLSLSHCGWNSVMESAVHGVPLLAWPMLGDQRLIATVIRSGGFGLWMEHWSWDGENVVSGVEIGEKVRELMGDEAISARAAKVREEATKAVAHGGTSYRNMQEFLATLKATF